MSVNSINLYTQPNCPFCDIMKEMLDKTGFTYYTVNIAENAQGKTFLKEAGHKTVPQLYVGDIHINRRKTQSYTPSQLEKYIRDAMDYDWPEGNGEQGL